MGSSRSCLHREENTEISLVKEEIKKEKIKVDEMKGQNRCQNEIVLNQCQNSIELKETEESHCLCEEFNYYGACQCPYKLISWESGGKISSIPNKDRMSAQGVYDYWSRNNREYIQQQLEVERNFPNLEKLVLRS